MKETLKRAARTFLQAAAGYIAANLVISVTGAGSDGNALKNALVTLVAAALAAGLAAVMNLPRKNNDKDKGGV